MGLSDNDIRRELNSGALVIEPRLDEHIGPCSMDFKLCPTLRLFKKQPILGKISGWLRRFSMYVPLLTGLATWFSRFEIISDPVNGYKGEQTVPYVMGDDGFILEPGAFILGATVEYVEIPHHLWAIVDGRSSIARHGVTIHVTAGFVDAGYKGIVTLEIKHLGEHPVRLSPGMKFGQFVFEKLDTPCLVGYGERLGSKYQGQTSPVESIPDNRMD